MKIRFAQYGISHGHAAGKASVIKSDDVDFAGVYERSSRYTRTNQAYEGVHWFSSAEEMLEDETIVAVAAQGRVSENLEFARAALERGKHVWLDKPAGDDLEAFRAVLDIAREKGLCIQLGYMFRYNAGFQFLIDWANSGKLGDIFSIRGRISSSRSDPASWKLKDSRGEREGGIMFILACHLIDIVVAILGRPERAEFFSQNLDHVVPWYRDNTTSVFEYADALVTIESTSEVSTKESRPLRSTEPAAA